MQLGDSRGAALGGKFYVVGGREDFGMAPSARLFEHTPGDAGWLERASMGTSRMYPAVVAHDGALWVWGGLGTSAFQVLATGERWDPVTNAWTPLPPLPLPMDNVRAVAVGTSIFVIGGSTGVARLLEFRTDLDLSRPSPAS